MSKKQAERIMSLIYKIEAVQNSEAMRKAAKKAKADTSEFNKAKTVLFDFCRKLEAA